MSANLELVHAIYDRWERGDWGWVDWADPQIEFVVADGPDPRSVTGVGAMSKEWATFLEAWSDYAVRGEEFREVDGEHVLTLLNATGQGKASGVDLAAGNNRGANLFHIRDGLVKRLAIYFDHRRALAELGLDD